MRRGSDTFFVYVDKFIVQVDEFIVNVDKLIVQVDKFIVQVDKFIVQVDKFIDQVDKFIDQVDKFIVQVDEVDGFVLVRAMAAEVQIMMQHKIDAIKRIMELAENIALDHKYDKVIKTACLRNNSSSLGYKL